MKNLKRFEEVVGIGLEQLVTGSYILRSDDGEHVDDVVLGEVTLELLQLVLKAANMLNGVFGSSGQRGKCKLVILSQ